MTDSFARSFGRLAAQSELEADIEDEHSRFALYKSLRSDTALRQQLLECLAQDPDPSLVESEVAALLELGPPEDRDLLLSIAPASTFLTTRANDVELLSRIARDVADEADLEAVIAGTDWLQRRVVARARSPQVLDRLATEGRTRKVRNAAVQALGPKDRD